MRHRRRVAAVSRPGRSCLAVALAFLAAACDRGDVGSGAGGPTAVRAPGERIRIGYAVEEPYAYVAADGRVTGESIEVARHVVEALGIRHVEWVQTEFGQLLAELTAGRFDVVAAGMFITPERARVVAFSEPTFRVREGLLVRRGNPLSLHSYEGAAARAGTRLAAISGSVEEGMLARAGFVGAWLVAVPDAATGRVAVQTAAVDGFALSSLALRRMIAAGEAEDVELATPFEQPRLARPGLAGFGAFAFRPADHRLRDRWNAELARYVGSPAHRALVARFGFTGDELPGGIRTADILAASPGGAG